jgi:hypothetical protein
MFPPPNPQMSQPNRRLPQPMGQVANQPGLLNQNGQAPLRYGSDQPQGNAGGLQYAPPPTAAMPPPPSGPAPTPAAPTEMPQAAHENTSGPMKPPPPYQAQAVPAQEQMQRRIQPPPR